MKKLLVLLILGIISTTIVSAVCTVVLDKTTYAPLETATATMVCTTPQERSLAYDLEWSNGTVVIETDSGITPSITAVPFFETLDIPSGASWTNANATLIGALLEGEDFFNVTGAAANALIISEFGSSSNVLMGRTLGIEFEVLDDNSKLISGADCEVAIEDSMESSPILLFAESDSHAGEVHGSQKILTDTFDEGRQYAANIYCWCGVSGTTRECVDEDGGGVTNSVGISQGTISIGTWLTVNTITDKSAYTLSDDGIYVCANISNAQSERVTIEIEYNYRCDGADDATDRVIIDSFVELRGITNGTTQNQCALLEIVNVPSVQNDANTCYAATDVRVLSKDSTEIYVTYATTSPSFTLTSNSNVLETNLAGDNMIAIAIMLIGIMFFLIYISTTISIRNDEDELVPINAMMVMILYVTAGFMAYFLIQIAFGAGLDGGLGIQTMSGVRGIHQFASGGVIILLSIVIIGVLINVGSGAIAWVQKKIG